jgi:HK97 family phage major capsid protein
METLNPFELKRKSASELWQMRKRVGKELETLADNAEGRDFTADERALEERSVKNLKAIDSVIEESFRDQTMSRYNGMGSPQLSARDMDLDAWAREALQGKRPGEFTLQPEERGSTISQPGLEYRSLWESRDTLTSTATQALPVSVYPRFVMHLVEQTPVLRAGAMLIQTETGEDLKVPKTTGFVTSALTGEGATITESDPTLAAVTLKAYKYASLWQLSRELLETSPANLLDTLAQNAATSLALAYGVHLAAGTGSGQPLGYTVGGTVGVTGPSGTGTTFGNQATAGQGSDLIFDLYSSIAEPYLLSPAIGVLGRNATFGLFRKVKEGTTNKPMFDLTAVKAGSSVNLLGMPGYVDPHAPAPANTAKSLAFGDWSRFAVRVKRQVRLDRSDEFAFDRDLVTFRAIIELDGAIIDANAVKLFQHTT